MKKLFSLVIIFLLLTKISLFAQDASPVNIFGYFQATINQFFKNDLFPKERNNFLLDQLNIYLQKDFGSNFGALISLEFKQNYSTENGWGSFNLDEAFFTYNPSMFFNLKAGILVPKYGNLNEIKNKTPLLLQITRPHVYDATFSNLLNLNYFVPQKTNIEVYGMIPFNGIKMEYAVYVGNNDPFYISKGNNLIRSGVDTNQFKMAGGRIGIKWNEMKAGISYVADHENRNSLGIGNLPRNIVNFDLSYSLEGFTFEGEYIYSKSSLDEKAQKIINDLHEKNPVLTGTNFARTFFYGILSYEFAAGLIPWGSYEYMVDEGTFYYVDGVIAASIGANYKLSDQILLKSEYSILQAKNFQINKFKYNRFAFGISVNY